MKLVILPRFEGPGRDVKSPEDASRDAPAVGPREAQELGSSAEAGELRAIAPRPRAERATPRRRNRTAAVPFNAMGRQHGGVPSWTAIAAKDPPRR